MTSLEEALFELRVQVLLRIAQIKRFHATEGIVRAYARTMEDREVLEILRYRGGLLGRVLGRLGFSGGGKP